MRDSNPDRVPAITLRVPGCWASPRDLDERLRAAGTGYALSLTDQADGPALVHTATGRRFEFDVAGPDGEIADVFAGGGGLTEAELAAIADHDVKVFITGPGGSVEAARAAMRAAAALVRAGGLGVLVDNCGATHAARDWLKLADDDQPGRRLLGPGVRDRAARTPCSPPACTASDSATPRSPTRRRTCGRPPTCCTTFSATPTSPGATLTDGGPLPGWDGPGLDIRHVDCDRFEPGTPFHNPYGVWVLAPAED